MAPAPRGHCTFSAARTGSRPTLRAASPKAAHAPIVDLSLADPARSASSSRSKPTWTSLVRRVQVTNRSSATRDLRLLFHHDFTMAPATDGIRRPGIRSRAASSIRAAVRPRQHGDVRRAGRSLLDALRASEDAPGAEGARPRGPDPRTARSARGRVDSLAGAPLAPGAAAMVTIWIATGATLAEARGAGRGLPQSGGRGLGHTRVLERVARSGRARSLRPAEDVSALYLPRCGFTTVGRDRHGSRSQSGVSLATRLPVAPALGRGGRGRCARPVGTRRRRSATSSSRSGAPRRARSHGRGDDGGR